MPTYKVRDPESGRVVTLQGDSPPSEAELEGIFGALNNRAEMKAATPGQNARARANESPLGYLGDAVANVPGDVIRQGKGLVEGIAALLRGDVPLSSIPDAVVKHYGGYLDSDERARRVKDEPVGTVLDLLPVGGVLKGAAKAGATAARKAPAMVAKLPAVAKDAVVGAAKGAAVGAMTGEPITGGLIGGAVGALKRRAAGAVGDAVEDAVTSKANKAASDRMVSGMGEAAKPKVDTATIAREVLDGIEGRSTADNVHLRSGSTKKGIILPELSNVAIADRIREVKAARRAVTDASERARFDAELALLEKAQSQRRNIHYDVGVRDARKVNQ